MVKNCIRPIYGTLTGSPTPDQRGPSINGNEGAFQITLSDSLVSHQGHLLGGSFHSEEM